MLWLAQLPAPRQALAACDERCPRYHGAGVRPAAALREQALSAALLAAPRVMQPELAAF